MQEHTSAEPVTQTIIQFLRAIGLEIRAGETREDTVLPGVAISQGALVYDEAKLRHPGDLLHEAGHLAMKLPAERAASIHDTGGDPGEEMAAIAWSYAAAVHLKLPPEVVFHPEGYSGGSAALIENFTAGRNIGVPMLVWHGLTTAARHGRPSVGPVYPAMIRWLR